MWAGRLRAFLLGGLAAGGLCAPAPAVALTINLIDIGGVTGSPAEAGFRAAANYWESVLASPANVTIRVGFEDLGSDTLGGSSSTRANGSIDAYYGALTAHGASALDATALAHLTPTNFSGAVQAIVPGYVSPGFGIDPTSSRLAPSAAISSTLGLTTANLKALGVDLAPGVADGQIRFSSSYAFDFNPADGIAPGTYDFTGLAIHEIAHTLGFASGLDKFEASAYAGGAVDSQTWAMPLDLFRYTDAGGDPALNWSLGAPAYFSIDGGETPFLGGFFSTGATYGDGWQPSHWKAPGAPCPDVLGIMNPYLCPGVNNAVTALDLAALDAIGWNLKVDVLANPRYRVSTADMARADEPPAAAPEPAAWLLMILGSGLAGLRLRRRRRAELAPASSNAI